ncbi:hypothetical protein BKA62DRAFT_711416 [Auriculariales sp. MPI-PUGE-AT-0066]|nr:hypothetical protein BKA62DRAFT_711416 [Auriculariales sp. MPI-PUGE-AT-0066]
MSLPASSYDPRRVFLLSCPSINIKNKRTIGVYLAGALFALAQWTFFDAAILSAHAHPPADAPHDTIPVHVTFLDWVPGIATTIGLLVVNLVDKETLMQGDSREVWRARLVLFLGFAFMAGGLAGSVVVLVLKYLMQDYPDKFAYYGYASVVQNVTLMLSAVVLWLGTQSNNEYEYSLTL